MERSLGREWVAFSTAFWPGCSIRGVATSQKPFPHPAPPGDGVGAAGTSRTVLALMNAWADQVLGSPGLMPIF